MKRGILVVFAVLACGGVNQPPASAPGPSVQVSNLRLDSIARAGVLNAYRYNHEDPALLSVLFRRLAQLADTGHGNNFAAYCLYIGAKPAGDSVVDPSPTVLQQLGDLPLPVRPHLGCRASPSIRSRTSVIDTVTHGHAVLLHVIALNLHDETSLTAEMDWYIGPEWAAGWSCEVIKQQNQWRVDQCRITWVS